MRCYSRLGRIQTLTCFDGVGSAPYRFPLAFNVEVVLCINLKPKAKIMSQQYGRLRQQAALGKDSEPGLIGGLLEIEPHLAVGMRMIANLIRKRLPRLGLQRREMETL